MILDDADVEIPIDDDESSIGSNLSISDDDDDPGVDPERFYDGTHRIDAAMQYHLRDWADRLKQTQRFPASTSAGVRIEI